MLNWKPALATMGATETQIDYVVNEIAKLADCEGGVIRLGA